MARSTSTSVCLPLLLLLSAVGATMGTDLTGLCNRQNMPYVYNLNLDAIEGEWYLKTMTMDLNMTAYKLNFTRTVPFGNPWQMNYLYIEAKAVTEADETVCMNVTSLNAVGFSYYSSNKWAREANGSLYVFYTNFYVLDTDYETTLVMMTEPVFHGASGMGYNHIDIYVRNVTASPDSNVVSRAVDNFCGGALTDISSSYYTDIPYTNVPSCF